MRWRTGRESDNVEDRRGFRAAPTIAGGGIGTIILVLVALYFGIDPSFLPQSGTPNRAPTQQSVQPSPADDESRKFVSVVLADTEDTWRDLFRRMGGTYQDPKLVLFTGAVQSACGFAQAAVGPFYCPADRKVYIDLGFFEELKARFRAPGDFAKAYVIAHEIGHHVQNLLGISHKVESLRGRSSQSEANAMSVRLELQADCFAGVWAFHANRARQILEAGDIEAALNAATAIGDDRLQIQARGYVVPDSFTHGSSTQRVRWFKRGITGGDLRQCDTFNAAQL
ncbi:MAG: neutral zinc metallopeptidase [Candidatus Contendobacter sp.]|nr:neutral zinc metallopeptidase [Candidatus Contendobacter sp.]MDS4058345.1 neutral zinc metallopeptidase [Candidatus Contendobacter sp.]